MQTSDPLISSKSKKEMRLNRNRGQVVEKYGKKSSYVKLILLSSHTYAYVN